MNRHKTLAIVLRRTNYKEADRIVSVISRDFGRLSVLARGARRVKSRMAGGIEPFSVAKIEFIRGRGELATLVSARSEKYFETLVKQYDRAVLAGEMLKIMNSLIEDETGEEFFNLAEGLLVSLDDKSIAPAISEVWFRLNLLGLMGRQPELLKDSAGADLDADKTYHFDPTDGVFFESQQGQFKADQIKGWRVLTLKTPTKAKQVKGLAEALEGTQEPLRLFMAENNF